MRLLPTPLKLRGLGRKLAMTRMSLNEPKEHQNSARSS